MQQLRVLCWPGAGSRLAGTQHQAAAFDCLALPPYIDARLFACLRCQHSLPACSVLWGAFWHPFNVILLLLAATSVVTRDAATAAIMLTMVALSTALRFWQARELACR